MKNRLAPLNKQKSTIALVVAFLIGICLLLYPSVSNYWNSFHSTEAMAAYSEAVNSLSDEVYESMLQAARDYNEGLQGQASKWVLSEAEEQEYMQLLDAAGTSVMGTIDIPKIRVSLPIYHGTSEEVLQAGVGHLEGSSLPVGGEGTHCVLSGHRGLPSARLFTQLDKLEVGDTFVLTVLNETLTYEVDQILIVEPDDLDALQIEEGKDYCTLVTCTPYGINTHRLLVRGHRVANDDVAARVSADALKIEPTLIAPLLAIPVIIALLIVLLVVSRRKRKEREIMEQKAAEVLGNVTVTNEEEREKEGR